MSARRIGPAWSPLVDDCKKHSVEVDYPPAPAVPNVQHVSEPAARYKGQLAERQEKIMLWTIVAVCLILWLLGFSLHIAGSLIHLLLVVALVVFVINLLNGRRGAA
jgi:hypothetical protein